MNIKTMLALASAAALLWSAPGRALDKKMTVAAPGIPPIFASVQLYVAAKEGLFAKYGADVDIRTFDSGATASRAVLAGDIDMSVSPSALVINQISNADANVVALYGMINSDMLLGSVNPAKAACTDVRGQPVGVDTPGGARSLALRNMLASGCPGVKIDDVQQVALSSNVSPAMLAGRLDFGVLHVDDVAVLENQGRKVIQLLNAHKTDPNGHYLLFIVRRDKLQENRPAYVHLMAGLIAAARFIRDPASADKVAADAAPTGLAPAVARATIKPLIDIDYWPAADDGLDRTRLEHLSGLMKKVGGIRPDKTPVTYERLVDESVWKDAAAMVK